MNEIQINKIIRSKRKTICLLIDWEGSLIVRAPLRTSQHEIEDLVLKKSDWIFKKQFELKNRTINLKKKSFAEGGEFAFLGNNYLLKIRTNPDVAFEFENNSFYIDEKKLKYAPGFFIYWYKSRAYEIISERVKYFSSLYNIKYNQVKINSAQRQYGSCSYNGNLNFAWRLVIAPLDVIDYVVIHELAHIKEKNHSRSFWDHVSELMPEYKQKKKWLSENHMKLNLFF